MSATPPSQLPPAAEPPDSPKGPENDGLEQYNTVAETLGGIPSLRRKDNVYQAIAIAVATLLGGVIGSITAIIREVDPWYLGLLLGVVGGLVAGTLLSGIVLMILGWVRAAGKLKPGTAAAPPRSPRGF